MPPKQRHNSSRRNRRRNHVKPKVKSAQTCPKCASAMRPHRACPSCGTYKGAKVK
ncbi:MAG TPA: 50S ribosomal protein L32 [Patescibacteria group bacterium]|nr:50S ribosomal protein L32 [Patescibacteria group bacterium]